MHHLKSSGIQFFPTCLRKIRRGVWLSEYLTAGIHRHIEPDPELQDQPLTLGLLLSYGVMEHQEDIQRISIEATQEGVLSKMLIKVCMRMYMYLYTCVYTHVDAYTHVSSMRI